MMNRFTLPIIIVILVVTILGLVNYVNRLSDDLDRVSDNFSQIQNENYQLKLNKDEFVKMLKESNDKNIQRVDSIMRANKINIKSVTEVNNAHYYYKDTNIIQIPINKLEPIEISIGDSCWGFNGILSKDSLIIKDKWSNANIDLVKYMQPKRFLFIRIGWKGEQIKAFSDCGNVNISSIKIVKD